MSMVAIFYKIIVDSDNGVSAVTDVAGFAEFFSPARFASRSDKWEFPKIWELNSSSTELLRNAKCHGTGVLSIVVDSALSDKDSESVSVRESIYQCLMWNLLRIEETFSDSKDNAELLERCRNDICLLDWCFNNLYCDRRFNSSNESLFPKWRKTENNDGVFKASEQSVEESGIKWMNNVVYSFRGKYYVFNRSAGVMVCDEFQSARSMFVLSSDFALHKKGSRFRILGEIERCGKKYFRLADGNGIAFTIGRERGEISKVVC